MSRPFECEVDRIRTRCSEPALQQARRLRIEEVRVAADLVHRPVHALFVGDESTADPDLVALRRIEHLRAPDHVVEDEAAADRGAVAAGRVPIRRR